MTGQIKVNYDVMDQIIGDIYALAGQTRAYARPPAGLGRSRGDTAGSLQSSAKDVAAFAKALADVIEDTAQRLEAAEAEMKATDEGLSTQFDGTGSTAAGYGPSRRAPDSNGTPHDVRLGGRAATGSGRAIAGGGAGGGGGGGGRSFGNGRHDGAGTGSGGGGGGGHRFGGGRHDGSGGSSGGGGAGRSFGSDGGGSW